ASYNLREFAKAGGLMSYGTSVTEASRQAVLFARLGSAHENACGIVPRPSLQPLHQALQQPGAWLDRREEHVFMIRVCAGAVDAESIERWDPYRDREIAVRSAADERRPLQLEANLLCNGRGFVEQEIDAPSTHERWACDLARHRRFDVGSRRFQGLDLSFHLACTRMVAETQVHLDHAFFRDRISSGATINQSDIRRDAARMVT